MNEPTTIPIRNAHASPNDAASTGRARVIVFRVAAVVIGVLPFVLLEAGLRLLNIGRPTDHPDPFAGFNRAFPLFEKQGAVYRTARGRAPFIAPQEFPLAKPPGG